MQLSNSSVCNLTVLLAVPGTGEVKHTCVHAMEACGGIAPLNLNLDTTSALTSA